MTQTARKIKRSSASLKGGIIVGIFLVFLATLICEEMGYQPTQRWILSLLIGGVAGTWVRIADL
jgi:hypothetical protein